jgi:DNA polymerase-3 subunit epsilon
MGHPRQNLLFVDCETTGLDAEKHEIIDIATILTRFDGETVLERWEQRAIAERISDAEPGALIINGYNEHEWFKTGAVRQIELAKLLTPRVEKATFVGQNVSFDEGFIRGLFKRHSQKPNWDYHKVDTAALFWPLFVNHPELQGVSLKYSAPYLGIEPEPELHRAMVGAETCRRVYVALMKRYAGL